MVQSSYHCTIHAKWSTSQPWVKGESPQVKGEIPLMSETPPFTGETPSVTGQILAMSEPLEYENYETVWATPKPRCRVYKYTFVVTSWASMSEKPTIKPRHARGLRSCLPTRWPHFTAEPNENNQLTSAPIWTQSKYLGTRRNPGTVSVTGVTSTTSASECDRFI